MGNPGSGLMARPSSEIQEDLTAAYASRRTALQAQEYGIDSGQGRQNVKRANLQEINKTIRDLESELSTALDSESGGSGIIAANFQRYC